MGGQSKRWWANLEKIRAEVFQMPKGFVPVLVGEAKELQRFLVRVEVFKHPSFVGLLELASQEFGYEQKGVLKIPCDIVHFQRVLESISKAM